MLTHIASPTRQTYNVLEFAYEFFDRCLFNHTLPPCLITLNRHPAARGYFSPQRFNHRNTDQTSDEIALNPDTFIGRTDLEILSTLVHEQVHLWQHHFGQPSRNRYHNSEWATQMEALGLMPSDTGAPGGKRTGQSMTHYIVSGGRFESVAQRLLATGFKLSWQSPAGGRAAAPQSKIKYSCAKCGQNAWAKPDAHLVCGDCGLSMSSTVAR